MKTAIYAPGPDSTSVCDPSGRVHKIPSGWALLPPGDATLTRRVKEAGEAWQVQVKRGRKIFSRGVFAPAATIERIRQELAAERATPAYARQRAASSKRRDAVQQRYVESFRDTVEQFLAFHATYASLARALATAVAEHATPIGSGTVARTERIPIEKRAEAAVIAWMRHQTTGYDSMHISRRRGDRRSVRQQLAAQSRRLLERYRAGLPADPQCPLQAALLK